MKTSSGNTQEKLMSNTVWKCEQWRAGQVLSKMMFYSREEAENFCAQMRKMEPDIFWRMEPVEAKLVWN
jgi:hypothetical protein